MHGRQFHPRQRPPEPVIERKPKSRQRLLVRPATHLSLLHEVREELPHCLTASALPAAGARSRRKARNRRSHAKYVSSVRGLYCRSRRALYVAAIARRFSSPVVLPTNQPKRHHIRADRIVIPPSTQRQGRPTSNALHSSTNRGRVVPRGVKRTRSSCPPATTPHPPHQLPRENPSVNRIAVRSSVHQTGGNSKPCVKGSRARKGRGTR